jgi:hypothetical protein
MAVAISADLDTTRLAALLSVSGLPAATATLSISRVGPSGVPAGVRGSVGVVAHAPTYSARDFEVPLDVSVIYTVTVYDAAGAVVGSATMDFQIAYADCRAWLVDLARSTNSLVATVESMNELDYLVPSGIHRVLNRRAPVVSALPAWTPSSELIVLTDTQPERDRVRALLGTGYPFLLRTEPEQGIGNMYLTVTEFVEERFLSLGTATERRFRIQVVQVNRPDPSIYVPVAPNTYANVKATFATYADLKAGVADYDELAYTYPEGINPVPIWPPDDV